MKMQNQLQSKLTKLEKEVKGLKISLVKSKAFGKQVSLKGMLKGTKISEKDIHGAKKSLFPGI